MLLSCREQIIIVTQVGLIEYYVLNVILKIKPYKENVINTVYAILVQKIGT